MFPGDSDGKESTCNAGDPGAGHGFQPSPHRAMWAYLMAQRVKNLPAM